MNVMHEFDVRTLGAWNRVHVLTASEKAEACNKQFHSAFVVSAAASKRSRGDVFRRETVLSLCMSRMSRMSKFFKV